MKFLLAIFFFASANPVDSLPPEPQLLAALDSFYHHQTTADLSELQTKTQHEWLKYLPTLGLIYTIDGQPRPSISWSSNLIYSSQKSKAQSEGKRLSIRQKNQLLHQKERLQLQQLIRKYHYLEADLILLKQLHQYDHELFKIQKIKADSLIIPPSAFITSQRDFEKKAFTLRQKERELLELEIEILITAKYFEPKELD